MKPYLVITDTTEEVRARLIPRGLRNVHVILAESLLDAKLKYVKLFNQQIIQEIFNSIYVYDLTEIQSNLSNITNSLPIFSFISLNGARPPKTVFEQLNNVPQVQTTPVVQQQPVVRQQVPQASQFVTPSPRSQEFSQVNRQVRQDRQQENSQQLTPQQLQLIAQMGAIPNNSGEENTKINSATGVRSVNQQQVKPAIETTNLSKEQLALLSGVVDISTLETPVMVEDDVANSPIDGNIYGDLDRVDSSVLSDEDIQRLQNELQG